MFNSMNLEILKIIIRKYKLKLEAIVKYGSFGTPRMHEGSDIDLLFIVKKIGYISDILGNNILGKDNLCMGDIIDQIKKELMYYTKRDNDISFWILGKEVNNNVRDFLFLENIQGDHTIKLLYRNPRFILNKSEILKLNKISENTKLKLKTY